MSISFNLHTTLVSGMLQSFGLNSFEVVLSPYTLGVQLSIFVWNLSSLLSILKPKIRNSFAHYEG